MKKAKKIKIDNQVVSNGQNEQDSICEAKKEKTCPHRYQIVEMDSRSLTWQICTACNRKLPLD